MALDKTAENSVKVVIFKNHLNFPYSKFTLLHID
jgi:hypothetical protein